MLTRTERDTFGPIEVPADQLWGAQTQRSLQNFDISGEQQPREIIRALALVKRASAVVNQGLGLQDGKKTGAIVAAADEVIADVEIPAENDCVAVHVLAADKDTPPPNVSILSLTAFFDGASVFPFQLVAS